MILETLVVTPFATNCYIVGSEKAREGIVIDPGGDPRVILSALKKLGLKIVLIVLTHTHIDHIGATQSVMLETDAPLALHPAEGRGISKGVSRVLGSIVVGSFQGIPEPDKLLQDGDKIEIADLTFTVLHTPGHSPGGISLAGEGVVFTGDALFNLSIGRTDLPGGNYNQLINSIQSKLMVLPDETAVLPGHGPESTIGYERRWNPFLQG